MIRWPIELIDDIAKRNSVLYLGSGISAASKNDSGKSPATWRKFLEDILDARQEKLKTCHDTIKQLLDKGNYLTACEIIVRHLGERDFGELAADEFRRPGYRPNELHKIIFSLDSRLVITPNIDKIYDQYATTQSNGTVIIKTYRDDIARYLRAPDYLIIKAHGTIDDTDHIVFTHGQYSRVRNDHAAFYRMLDALLLTHTFIFWGCGISDPDIQLVLENFIFSVKISIPLENTGVSSVFATSVWPFSLIFSLTRRNEGNFFQAVPTTLSSSLAEVRLASLVAWA